MARLETSFVILGMSAKDARVYKTVYTYHIDSTIPRNSNDGVERPQINSHNRHVDQRLRRGSRECGSCE